MGGLVQIPCSNAVAPVKAINAARMAFRGDGSHHVSQGQVIKTMRETGAEMMTKYKETARGAAVGRSTSWPAKSGVQVLDSAP